MKKIIIGILCIILSAWAFSQKNYYVSTSGNDSNDGSIGSPWKTIHHGATQLAPSDSLNIRTGTYAGKIDLNESGSNGQEITIRAYENENVIINGSGLDAYEYLLKIENADYITIEGIKFQDYQKLDAIGIIVISSGNISILNNEFSNIDYSSSALGQKPNASKNSQPIIVFGRNATNPINNLRINGNIIHDCETGYSECLSINGNVDGFEVMNNHIYDNTNIPIVAIGFEGECPNTAYDQARNGLIKNNHIHDNPSAYAAAGGIYIDGGKSIIVENNVVYNNDYGIEIGCENNGDAPNDPSASDITVRNNVIYNNKISGIALGGYDYPSSGKVESTIIRNNTCYNNDTDDSYNGELYISYVENSRIENNIFYVKNTDNVFMISSDENSTVAFNYNIYYTSDGSEDIVIEIGGEEYNEFSTYQDETSQDANSEFSDPLFVSTTVSDPNLHLSSSSPSIDNGNPSFTSAKGETDMDGEKRVFNGVVDCGADEYGSSVGLNNSLVNPIRFYPNPTRGMIHLDLNIQNLTYEVFSLNGKLSKTGTIVNYNIDLTNLNSGLYLIKIFDVVEGEEYEGKVLIED